MSCGTGRISRGVLPKSPQEKWEDALRAWNEPAVYDTITEQELEEMEEYSGIDNPSGRSAPHERLRSERKGH